MLCSYFKKNMNSKTINNFGRKSEKQNDNDVRKTQTGTAPSAILDQQVVISSKAQGCKVFWKTI